MTKNIVHSKKKKRDPVILINLENIMVSVESNGPEQ